MRIVLTGGGTGGHLYPAVSVAQALWEIEPSVELLFVGSSHGPEGAVAAEAGIPFQAVPSSPLTRQISARNAVSMVRLLLGVFRARRILRKFGPNVVLGTGGYTTAAVLVAQKTLGGRIVIHEQNVVPGRTNRHLARIADRVCVSFETSAGWFPVGKVVVTGLPVRKEFSSLPDKKDARRALGLRDDLFTLLVVGGSQGARRLNELIMEAWPLMDDGSTQVLHQVGPRNVDQITSCSADGAAGLRYCAEAYVNMPVAMAAADLVIGRSGASTVAEITACGLPSILVPYPHAVADEQTANARYLADRGAALVFRERTLTPDTLAGAVIGLKASPDKLAAMSESSRSLGVPDAALRVAQVVLDVIGQ
ncbi:MAG: undecaprenyldiphospho-muramoylpentapeptide beta-N-acetylglucosaminyltransferase [Armatimonadota bacterium]